MKKTHIKTTNQIIQKSIVFVELCCALLQRMVCNLNKAAATADNHYFMSCLPWIRFTSLSHAMNIDKTDAVPRISWGKYQSQDLATLMPVQIQVHHALVDGEHLGLFYQQLQHLLDSPESWPVS